MIAINRETLRMFIPEFRLNRFSGVQTTQLTKYPESKEMRGIMKLKKKEEKIKGFKLTYHCEIKERTAEETISEFLLNEKRWQIEREKSKST
jgi:hypothetical protein